MTALVPDPVTYLATELAIGDASAWGTRPDVWGQLTDQDREDLTFDQQAAARWLMRRFPLLALATWPA